MVFLSIKSLPNLLSGVLCLPGDQSHPVWATDNKPSCVLHLLGSFIGSRGFSSLEQRPEFWVLQCHLTFDFGAVTLPSFGGSLTTWLLISGPPFALIYLECDSRLVRFWFGLSMQTSGTNCLSLYGKRFL